MAGQPQGTANKVAIEATIMVTVEIEGVEEERVLPEGIEETGLVATRLHHLLVRQLVGGEIFRHARYLLQNNDNK